MHSSLATYGFLSAKTSFFFLFVKSLSYITYLFHLTSLFLNILLCLPSSIKIMYYYLKIKVSFPSHLSSGFKTKHYIVHSHSPSLYIVSRLICWSEYHKIHFKPLSVTQSPPAKLLILTHFFTDFQDFFS